MSDAPNFRLSVRAEGDDFDVPTTLREFLADNEGAPDVCNQVKALAPGQEVLLGGGAGVTFHVRRFNVGVPRYTRVRVPISIKEFRGVDTATVKIDRKRLTLSIRPFQRRTVFEISLTELAEHYLAKQVKVNVATKKKARRSRR